VAVNDPLQLEDQALHIGVCFVQGSRARERPPLRALQVTLVSPFMASWRIDPNTTEKHHKLGIGRIIFFMNHSQLQLNEMPLQLRESR